MFEVVTQELFNLGLVAGIGLVVVLLGATINDALRGGHF